MNLSEVAPGKKVSISAIDGDIRFLSRITSIGLTVGCQIQVLQNEKRQPILIYGRDTMVALNRRECEKIQIGGAAK